MCSSMAPVGPMYALHSPVGGHGFARGGGPGGVWVAFEADGGIGKKGGEGGAEVELVWSAKESSAATAVQQMFICEEHTPYNNTWLFMYDCLNPCSCVIRIVGTPSHTPSPPVPPSPIRLTGPPVPPFSPIVRATKTTIVWPRTTPVA